MERGKMALVYPYTYFLEFILKPTMPQLAEQNEGYFCYLRGKSNIAEHYLLWGFSPTKVSILKSFGSLKNISRI